MDYYQGVVTEYLRADRSVFVNPECYIQTMEGKKPPKGLSWYCDILAVQFGSELSGTSGIFLCEVTYSENLNSLIRRLRAWNDKWDEVLKALVKYSHLPPDWPVRPWLFVPERKVGKECAKKLVDVLKQLDASQGLQFTPRITPLEMVQPWAYPDIRTGEEMKLKPACIPEEWQK